MPEAVYDTGPSHQRRVRHHRAPLQLHVARHARARSSRRTSPRGDRRVLKVAPRSSGATTRPRTRRVGSGPPRPTARGCRSPTCTGRASPSTGRPPACSTGTAPTRSASTPGSRACACRSSTAACVFAIAHVRGGGEMGRPWYDDGKLLHKRNTFTDFIAAAEHLVAEGYTSPERLAARGGSAGGLLMGAVANLRPDLFAAIVAEVPFVDCLTTILDETLPLTITEWEEWGNPKADPEVYAYVKGYIAVRQRRRPAVPGRPRHRRAQRPAGVVLGAGQVGAGPAERHHQRPDRAAQDRAGRGPPGPVGSLRRLEGRGVRLRVPAGRALGRQPSSDEVVPFGNGGHHVDRREPGAAAHLRLVGGEPADDRHPARRERPPAPRRPRR